MDKSKTLIFLSALVVLNPFASSVSAAPATYETIQKLTKNENAPVPEKVERRQVSYGAQKLKDPFQGPFIAKKEGVPEKANVGAPGPTAAEAEPLPPLNVQGIVWGGIFPQAIINDKVLKIGDSINAGAGQKEISIINIEKDGVIVTFNERQYRLPSPAAAGTLPHPL